MRLENFIEQYDISEKDLDKLIKENNEKMVFIEKHTDNKELDVYAINCIKELLEANGYDVKEGYSEKNVLEEYISYAEGELDMSEEEMIEEEFMNLPEEIEDFELDFEPEEDDIKEILKDLEGEQEVEQEIEQEVEEDTKKSSQPKTTKKRKKKKNAETISISELDFDEIYIDIGKLREFCLNNLTIKPEKMCLMNDDEVKDFVAKKYVCIPYNENILFIKNNANVIVM